MAPNGELLLGNPNFMRSTNFNIHPHPKPNNFSKESIQRAVSDLSFRLHEISIEIGDEITLPPISEVEDAKCECCGMCEECTPEYISKIRNKFHGKWICGLCSEAVKEEIVKNEGKLPEAIDAHMSACVRFNRFGRMKPVLYQAEAMREMLRKSTRSGLNSAKLLSPKEKGSMRKGGLLGVQVAFLLSQRRLVKVDCARKESI